MDRAADSGPCDPSSIPLGEKKENKRKEAGVGPFKKKKKHSGSKDEAKSLYSFRMTGVLQFYSI